MPESVDGVQGLSVEMWPGRPYPLGATFDGTGVNFALFSEVASKVELCLIDEDGEETRVELIEVDGNVWHAYIPRIQPGPALRLPGLRPVRARQRSSVQPIQVLAGSVREGHQWPDRRRRIVVLLPLRRPARNSTIWTPSATPCCRWSLRHISTGAMIDHHSTSTTRASSTRCT